MFHKLLKPAELGNAYDLADQSIPMISAGLSFLGFVVFMAFADLTDPDSVLSALTRFSGVVCAVATIATLQWALPKSLSAYKILMTTLGLIGVFVQFSGVNQLMKTTAEVSSFFGYLMVAQFFYTVVLLVFGICIVKHPLLPSWLAGGMFFAGIVWSVNYWYAAHSTAPVVLEFLAWGPAIAAEVACCVYFVLAGFKMRRLSKHAIMFGEPFRAIDLRKYSVN